MSGGNRYDDELALGLRKLGVDLCEYDVTGSWPTPTDVDREQFAGLFRSEQDWLVGNILGSAAPEALTAAVGNGRRVTMLVHYFPADDPELSPSQREARTQAEAKAVAAASTIVVTSAWAAKEISKRYGRSDAVIAVPGIERAELSVVAARSARAPTFLWLGSLTRTKDPITFVDALSTLADLDWSAQLVGPDTVDERLSSRVRDRIAETGLARRVKVLGAREGEALESLWASTDLLVHTSRSETYGMVVSEALARGIPAIVPSGTGAVEAQRVGLTFPPGDVGALADVLRTWLTQPQLRQRWRIEAHEQREQLPTWRETSHVVAAALTGPHGRG